MTHEGLITLFVPFVYFCIMGFILGFLFELDDNKCLNLTPEAGVVISLFWIFSIPVMICFFLGSFLVRKVWTNGRI